MAGKRAKKAGRLRVGAAAICRGASALVDDDGWQRRHDLVFELELHRAECEFLTGDIASAEQRLTMLSSRAATVVERVRGGLPAWRTSSCALQQPDRGLAECLECLRHAGLEIPMRPDGERRRKREYDRICSKLDGVGIDELAALPLMTDPTSRAILDVMRKVARRAAITRHESRGP